MFICWSLFSIICIGEVILIDMKDECNINADNDKKVLLSSHNQYRQHHGVPNVEWDDKLAESAQEWAYNLKKNGYLMFSLQSLSYSENVFKSSIEQFSLSNAVDHWYDTGDSYDYSSISSVNSGSFTQIVWDNVKFLGCGSCPDNSKDRIFVVCRYSPRANIGDYSKHVKAPVTVIKFRNITKHSFDKSKCNNLIKQGTQYAILEEHNNYRKNHFVADLKWNENLAANAEDWAYYIADQNKLQFSPESSFYSENIYRYASSADKYEPIKAVEFWYKFGKYYRYSAQVDAYAGAFTQIVWDDVKFLGCGSCSNYFTSFTYVVCRYNPRANLGDYSKHVKPPKEESKKKIFLDVDVADEIDVTKEAPFAHNQLRCLYHNVTMLKWDSDLAESAEYWSKVLAENGEIKPSPDSFSDKYGENIYVCHGYCNVTVALHEAIHYWYEKIKDYSFDTHSVDKINYHAYSFTQIVWTETKYLGCGVSLNKKKEITIVVCRYKPRGNIGSIDEFKKNVKAPIALIKEMASSGVLGKGREKDIPLLKDLMSSSGNVARLDNTVCKSKP